MFTKGKQGFREIGHLSEGTESVCPSDARM